MNSDRFALSFDDYLGECVSFGMELDKHAKCSKWVIAVNSAEALDVTICRLATLQM